MDFVRLVILFFVVLVCLIVLKQANATSDIVTAHVINMERSKDRLEEITGYAEQARMRIVRWPAVDGRTIEESDIASLKLSKIVYRSTKEKNQPGVIGCFLSHRSLMRHLATVPTAGNNAHLVLEDDAYIPPDFWQQWDEVRADLPADWDIVQLAVTFPNLKQLRGRIHTHLHDRGNVGAVAYVVRHRALKKINTCLDIMYDPVDVMYRDKWREWKMYIVWPEICPHFDHGKSTIVV